jgi:hypothetical protein
MGKERELKDFWRDRSFWIGLTIMAFGYLVPRMLVVLFPDQMTGIVALDEKKQIKDWAQITQTDFIILFGFVLAGAAYWARLFKFLISRIPFFGGGNVKPPKS